MTPSSLVQLLSYLLQSNFDLINCMAEMLPEQLWFLCIIYFIQCHKTNKWSMCKRNFATHRGAFKEGNQFGPKCQGNLM